MASLRLPEPDPALLERARLLYMETDMSLAAIGRLLGYSPQTMHTRRRDWGWPDRHVKRHPRQRPVSLQAWPDIWPAGRAEGAPAASASVDAEALARPDLEPGPSETAPSEVPDCAASLPIGDLAQQARRLERFVSRRIDHLEAEAALGRDRDPERTDRRLVQLERLLAQLGKRRGGHDGDTQPPARSVAELRDELLRHLRRLREERRPRRVDRDAGAA